MDAEDILGSLTPPVHFRSATFEKYLPEPQFPTQQEALAAVQQFARSSTPRGFSLFSLFSKAATTKNGLYLDGGFGVGKTHLLASAYHSFNGKKAYLSFQELMFLVGLITLKGTIEALQNYELLIIDEFELDDPANTRISATLLKELTNHGVKILTSSNTPPGALGEGKFSIEDFRRELGDFVTTFTSQRIDGEDYRISHRAADTNHSSWSNDLSQFKRFLLQAEQRDKDGVLIVTMSELLHILSLAHPIRVRKAIEQFHTLAIRDVDVIYTPHEALRFVYLIDKAYDNTMLLIAQGDILPSQIFHSSYFHGGDTKKYRRAISRLEEMGRTSYQILSESQP